MLEVRKTSNRTYIVTEASVEDYNEYFVWMDLGKDKIKFSCTCPYFIRKPGRKCKHIKEVIKYELSTRQS